MNINFLFTVRLLRCVFADTILHIDLTKIKLLEIYLFFNGASGRSTNMSYFFKWIYGGTSYYKCSIEYRHNNYLSVHPKVHS